MQRALAALLGTAVGLAPALDARRTPFELVRALSSVVLGVDASPGPVVILALDADTESHPAFADLPHGEWPREIAPVFDRLLDVDTTLIAIDVVWPLAGPTHPAWLATLRRGAREGRIVLGYLEEEGRTIAPHPAQVVALGSASRLRSLLVEPDAGRVRRVEPHLTAAVGAPGIGMLDPGVAPRVQWVSLAELVECEDMDALFRDRTVVVGAWRAFVDRHPSVWRLQPLAVRRVTRLQCDGSTRHEAFTDPVPGVLLHAVAATMSAAGISVRALPRMVEVMLLLGSALASLRLRAPATSALAILVIIMATWGSTQGWALPWAGMLAAMAAVTLLRLSNKIRLRLQEWAASLPSAYRRDPTRTELRELTVCFMDIERWTAQGEIADASTLAHDLTACLGHMSEVIEAHGGHVDKYLGDGLMALFGLDGDKDHPARAVSAVRQCFTDCAHMAIAGEPVRLRAGLACGPVRVGNIGRSGRVHFTAIGDAVNIAARLEQLNRALGTRILAEEAVAEACPGPHWRNLGQQALRGRSRTVGVWSGL